MRSDILYCTLSYCIVHCTILSFDVNWLLKMAHWRLGSFLLIYNFALFNFIKKNTSHFPVYFARQPSLEVQCIHQERDVCYTLWHTTRMTSDGVSACPAGEKMIALPENSTLKAKVMKYADTLHARGVSLLLWVESYRRGLCFVIDLQNSNLSVAKVNCALSRKKIIFICAMNISYSSECKWNRNCFVSSKFFPFFVIHINLLCQC